MRKKFNIITLCGDRQFKNDFIRAQERLTKMGNIVLSPVIFSLENISDSDLILLDNIQKQRIEMADKIFVINKNNHIDESTRKEIEYATIYGKLIQYMEEHYECK